ncbi:MAG: phospholipid carrier-dependent glycosyltransferase [Acidimicrobiia bacterium]|nr:phospholipid carrier-dependent glycosyltransferase [Acidimicrobiia bacterium]
MRSFVRSQWTPWALFAVLVILWLSDISGEPLAGGVRTWGVGLILAALCLWLGAWTVRLFWEEGGGRPRIERRWLLALVALALVVRFVGITWELIDHPRNDEGVFLATAERINDGALFPTTFNYGHFLYYAGALALWMEESLPIAGPTLSHVFDVATPYEVDWVVLKCIVALLGALTVPAVFATARRVFGGPADAALAAAGVSGLLITFSPLYNAITHQVISDVPSGFFAALCLLFVARLTERERLRDYLLAGVAAGLAAASKYPGGVVAVGIFGVWLYWRWRERSWSWSLVWAAAVSMLTMLAIMPGFIVQRSFVFQGQRTSLLLGFYQYARGGWLGVQPDSAALWYGGELVATFSWAAIILGLVGLAFLPRESRRRLALMLVFPVVFLALIGAMSMVVQRNLQPVLPILAVILGVGAGGWVGRFRRSYGAGSRQRWVATGAVLVAMLVVPVARTVAWDISRTRPSTRQLARNWIEGTLPDGVSILRESYTPTLDEERFHVQFKRFAAWTPAKELFSPAWDFLLLARNAHLRFMNEEAVMRDEQREYARRYRTIFDQLELVREWRPSTLQAGAHLLLYRAAPVPTVYRDSLRFVPADATYVSNELLRQRGSDQPFTYTHRWMYAVFKDFFEAGRYQGVLEVDRAPEEGYLYVVTPENREIGTWDASTRFEIELPERGKYLFRVFLAPPTELRGWTLRRIERSPGTQPSLESEGEAN